MKNQVVKYNHQEFKKALEVFDKKIATEIAIEKEFTSLIENFEYSLKALLESPKEYFYTSLEAAYQDQNSLKLSGQKLAELMQIDASELLRLANGYESLRSVKKPSKEAYTEYAETPDEIKRLDYCKSYISMINSFEKDFGRVFPKEAILSHSPQVVFFNFRANQYEPNLNFVKNLHSRI